MSFFVAELKRVVPRSTTKHLSTRRSVAKCGTVTLCDPRVHKITSGVLLFMKICQVGHGCRDYVVLCRCERSHARAWSELSVIVDDGAFK
jgi:hypothetical protein